MRNVTPFAALDSGPMEKQAYFQNLIDRGWNATMKPLGNAIGGAADVVGSGISNMYNATTAPVRALGSAVSGAWNGAQNGGGLGGFVQGGLDGAHDSAMSTFGTFESNFNKARQGLGRATFGAYTPGSPTNYTQHMRDHYNRAMGYPAPGGSSPSKPNTPNTSSSAPAPWFRSPQAKEHMAKYASVTPFALLEKRANKGKALLAGGKALFGRLGQSGVGSKAKNFGGKVSGAVKERPGAAMGAAGLGGGLIGHTRGRSTGLEDGRVGGINEGFDHGMQYGIQGAQSMTPGDPGVIGRLLNVFRGQQQGPDAQTIYSMLSRDRDQLLQRIIAGQV